MDAISVEEGCLTGTEREISDNYDNEIDAVITAMIFFCLRQSVKTLTAATTIDDDIVYNHICPFDTSRRPYKLMTSIATQTLLCFPLK